MSTLKISKNFLLKDTSESIDIILGNIIKALTKSFKDKKASLEVLHNYFNKKDPIANIDTVFPNFNDMNPIAIATFSKNIDEVKALIKMGACIDIKYQKSQQSLLHIAIAVESFSILKVLVEEYKKRNISVDIQDKDGTTPLMLACQRNKEDIVTLLLDAQANPLKQDNSQKNALDYLTSVDNCDVALKSQIESLTILKDLDVIQNHVKKINKI